MALNQLGLGFVFTAKDLASGVIGRVRDSFGGLEGRSNTAARAFSSNLVQFGQGLAVMGAGIAGLVALDRAVEASGRFSTAIAEVSTLIDESAFSTAELSRVSLQLAAVYGGSATGQAKALYQTISAGVTDAAQATDLLRVANELAVGGVTETKTAVDALTNVVNAYATSGAQARDVSDAFFVAIRAGKTTAAELAATIGRVAPTASSLGVSFSDLLASVAAITTQGLNTAEAVTGMKAALANIIKPTADATKEAGRLGIKFDAATLRAQGLTGFLRMITSSARFNADSLSKLFGSVEALNSVMALTANSSAKYSEILGQMGARSGATRAAFEKMADTLTFQQSRFKALKENVLIVIGQALEPVAKAIVRVANAVLEAFLRVPKPIRDFVVKVFAAVSTVLVLVGGMMAAKAGIALLALGLKALGITLGGVLLSMLPFLAIFGLLAATVWGFSIAFKRDMGGLGEFVKNVATKAKLAFRGLAQLFTEGGFSGAVMQELGRAENQGLKRFVINVYAIVYRLGRIWEGFKQGFKAAIDAAAPVFRDFVDSLRELGGELGGVFGGITKSAAGLPSEKFRAFGSIAGSALAAVVSGSVKLWAIANRIASGIAGAWRTMMEYVGPAFDTLKGALSDLSAAWGELWGSEQSTTQAAGASTSSWRSVGEVLAKVVGGAITVVVLALSGLMKVLNAVVWVVTKVKDAFVYVGTLIGETAAKIYLWFTEDIPRALRTAWAWIKGVFVGIGNFFAGIGRWFASIWQGIADGVRSFLRPIVEFFQGIVDGIRNMMDRMTAYVGKLAAKIPARFRPAYMDAIILAGKMAEQRIAERTARSVAPVTAAALPGGTAALTPGGAARAGQALGAAAAQAAMPGVAEVRARGELSDAELSAVVARSLAASEGRPVQAHVTLNVDGETLARVSAKAERSAAARSFMPVPVPG